jgi:hypothetical protein
LFGRKKARENPHTDPAGGSPTGVTPPTSEETFRLLLTFLSDPTGNQAPVWNTPDSSGGVFFGAEDAIPTNLPGGSNATIPLPGLGPVRVDHIRQAISQMEQLATYLADGADIRQGVNAGQLHTASERLETLRAQQQVTEPQYHAFQAILDRMRAEV